jgi:hypothetical protein
MLFIKGMFIRGYNIFDPYTGENKKVNNDCTMFDVNMKPVVPSYSSSTGPPNPELGRGEYTDLSASIAAMTSATVATTLVQAREFIPPPFRLAKKPRRGRMRVCMFIEDLRHHRTKIERNRSLIAFSTTRFHFQRPLFRSKD